MDRAIQDNLLGNLNKQRLAYTLKGNFGKVWLANLTTIGGPWYFDRAFVPQRLINQSLYQEILLLQKFNDIGKERGRFLFFLHWDFDLKISQLRKKVFMPTSKM